MKFEFNPDGSLKILNHIRQNKEEEDMAFQNEPSIKITRCQLSYITPLTCELIIQASDKLNNFDRIEFVYNRATDVFRHMANLSIRKTDSREYTVKIISGMYRCSWCENFKNFVGREMQAKVINCGSCAGFTSSMKH